MLVQELNGDELTLWVALAAGYAKSKLHYGGFVSQEGDFVGHVGGNFEPQYAPHENWSQGGPLFSDAGIGAERDYDGLWVARCGEGDGFIGETELIAKARAFVDMRFCSVVLDEVPV